MVRGSLADRDALNKLVADCDSLVHCAGLTRGVTRSQFNRVNAVGAVACAEAAREEIALAKAAEEYGISFVHFPVDAISITDEELKSFAAIADDLERPLFLFSRSGKRSIKLWEKAELL